MSADQYNNPNLDQDQVFPVSSLEEAARAAVRAARGEVPPVAEAEAVYERPELAPDYVELQSLSVDAPAGAAEVVTSADRITKVIPLSPEGGRTVSDMVLAMRGMRDAA